MAHSVVSTQFARHPTIIPNGQPSISYDAKANTAYGAYMYMYGYGYGYVRACVRACVLPRSDPEPDRCPISHVPVCNTRMIVPGGAYRAFKETGDGGMVAWQREDSEEPCGPSAYTAMSREWLMDIGRAADVVKTLEARIGNVLNTQAAGVGCKRRCG